MQVETGDATPPGAVWADVGRHEDDTGTLTAVEFELLPFNPVRAFVVTGVPAGEVRGGHAHREETQALICLSGSVTVDVGEGDDVESFRCQPDGAALILPPGVWARQRYEDQTTALLVLSSHPYDPDGYLGEERAELR